MYTAEILLENTKNTNLQISMKKFLIICMALFSLSQLGSAKETTYRARITYFSDGKKVAWSKQKTGVDGVSLAAHPNFKFGTKVSIPALKGIIGDGSYVIHDRGPAVTKKVAARGKGYVFDVYVSNPALVRKYAKALPTWMDVTVYE